MSIDINRITLQHDVCEESKSNKQMHGWKPRKKHAGGTSRILLLQRDANTNVSVLEFPAQGGHERGTSAPPFSNR